MTFRESAGKISGSAKINSQHEILIPTAIFCDRTLSFLEALVEYLHEVRKLNYHEIAVLTNRDERNIWTLYHRAVDKRARKPAQVKVVSNIFIPLSVVRDRSLSILEVVVQHLTEKTPLRNFQIALLLNRSDETVATVRRRIKKKWKTS